MNNYEYVGILFWVWFAGCGFVLNAYIWWLGAKTLASWLTTKESPLHFRET